MDIIIENGTTIVRTGVKAGAPWNKHGIKGLSFVRATQKYALALSYNGKKYHIGYYTTKDMGNAISIEAQEHIDNDTFLEWLAEYKVRVGMRKSRRKVMKNENTD